jgi:hypothetical protein
MDWFTPFVGFLGVAIGLGYQEYRIRRERKDKYKDIVFEKRLDAHQGAFYHCVRMLKFAMPDKLITDGGFAVAIKETLEGHEWLNKNALYLDRDSRTKMGLFFNYICETAIKYKDEKWRRNVNIGEETEKLMDNVAEMLACIERGVGGEYLPERNELVKSIDTEKMLDELIEEEEGLIEKKKGLEL